MTTHTEATVDGRKLGNRQREVLGMVATSSGHRMIAWHADTQRVMESLEARGLVEFMGWGGEYWGRARYEYRATQSGRRLGLATAHGEISTDVVDVCNECGGDHANYSGGEALCDDCLDRRDFGVGE